MKDVKVSMILKSPAKLNLVLDITRKREDGYHEVEIVFQELAIHDTLTVESLPNTPDIRITCTNPSVPIDSRNDCHKAALIMQEELKKTGKPNQGVSIHIEKKIPAAGGLGGGSSNAATVMKALNHLWKLSLSNESLAELGARIGSDVPFLIYGGTCLGSGRGEIVEPIAKCPRLHLAIIVPPIKVPEKKSAWIYSHFDVNKVTHHPSVDAMEDAIRKKDSVAVAQAMGNVFEFLELPEYQLVFNLIEGMKPLAGVWKAMLAGAGPTVCVVVDSQKTASTLIEPFRAKGWTAFTTTTA